MNSYHTFAMRTVKRPKLHLRRFILGRAICRSGSFIVDSFPHFSYRVSTLSAEVMVESRLEGRRAASRRVEAAGYCAMRSAVRGIRSTCIWCSLVIALSGQGPVFGDEPTKGDTAEARPKYLSLTQLDAYLELRGEYTHREVKTDGRSPLWRNTSQTNREWEIQERLGLSLGGVVLDPSFLTFGGDLSFALTQSRYEERGPLRDLSERDDGHLLQFNLRASLFSGKKISGAVYGLRQDDRLSRAFQPTLDQRRNGFGTNWLFNDAKLPMELSYDYLETERTGNSEMRDDEHFTESTLRFRADWLISTRQKLSFSYEHAENKQEYQGSAHTFETTRDLFTVEHKLDFGPEGRHSLNTLMNWQEESGDFARDFLRIGPQLSLKHSDSLQSLHKYQFNRERYEGLDVEQHRADLQLVHQMYTNLTTTFGLFGLHEDVEEDTRTTQYGASVDWQYNRSNRWGYLYANLALATDREDVDGDAGKRIFLDEAQTLRDPVAVTLRNRNAIPGTIVVTDSGSRRIYQKGLDYQVIQLGNVTRLTRVLTGRIVDGETVLIDYQIEAPQGGHLDTVRADFSIEQRFANGLTPYYRLSYRNQEDDESTGIAQRADRTDHHRLGVNFERPRYSLGAEYEIFDDTIDPYDGFHVNGLLHVVQQADHTLDASSRVSRFFFDGDLDDRDVTLIDADLNHRWRLTDSLSTLARVGYRFEDDSVDGLTHGWDVHAGLEYVSGELSAELTFEYDRLSLPQSDDEGFGVFVRVRRGFPDVLSRMQGTH